VFEHAPLRDAVLYDDRVYREPLFSTVRARVEFEAAWKRLVPWLPEPVRENQDAVAAARERVGEIEDIPEALMDLFCEGNRAAFAAGPLRFPDRHSLWVVVQEILVNEEYFFDTDNESPRILDCGAHFGMASFYFKTLYPKARITAFEPVPALHALASENMAANGFADVE